MGRSDDRIRALAADNRSGAAELTRLAAQILTEVLQHSEADTLPALRHELTVAAQALVCAQPAMASLFNLANEALWRAEASFSLSEAAAAVRDWVSGYEARRRAALDEMVTTALSLIGDRATVLTHSRSSTVLAILSRAHALGKRIAVTCAESRPMLEGRTLATELAQEGLAVELVVDAGVFALLTRVDLILVGGDSFSSAGLVNKIGTRGLAMAACQEGVPFYACCTMDKCFSHPRLVRPERIEHPPTEVWDTPPPQVRVINRYFDLTPLPYLTGMVTERGVLDAQAIAQLSGTQRVHRALADLFGEGAT